MRDPWGGCRSSLPKPARIQAIPAHDPARATLRADEPTIRDASATLPPLLLTDGTDRNVSVRIAVDDEVGFYRDVAFGHRAAFQRWNGGGITNRISFGAILSAR